VQKRKPSLGSSNEGSTEEETHGDSAKKYSKKAMKASIGPDASEATQMIPCSESNLEPDRCLEPKIEVNEASSVDDSSESSEDSSSASKDSSSECSRSR